MSQNIVHIENLVKRYGDLVALNHLNLDIKEGEVFGLLGPNGSGKTTAINCMLSLLKYDKGTIEIFGEPMSPDNYQVKKQIGIVLQNVAVFEELYGHKPEVVAIHAGLECGLFYKKMEGLDCVSLGPDMKDIHTSEEVLSIASTERVWNYLVQVLKNLKD